MVKLKDDVIVRKYYSSGDLAKRLNVSLQWILQLCKEFSIDPKRSSRGKRQFTVEQAEQVELACRLKKIYQKDHALFVFNQKVNQHEN